MPSQGVQELKQTHFRTEVSKKQGASQDPFLGGKLKLEKTRIQTEGGLTAGGRFTAGRLWLHLNPA